MSDEQYNGLRASLREIPDPCHRQGRLSPVVNILIMLIVAAVHGQRSLRGMVRWAEAHGSDLRVKGGIEWLAHPPISGTLWRIGALLDMAHVEHALSRWMQDGGGDAIGVDAKSLRGSQRREGLPALAVVVAAAQGIRIVLRRNGVAAGNVTDAALQLLQGMPLEGKVVTLDAEPNHR